jgi:peptide/nickel transport system substrate-binding protein
MRTRGVSLFVLIVLLGGGLVSPPASAQAPSSITIVVPADIRSLDKAVENLFNSAIVGHNIFDRLFQFDENMHLQPMLALSSRTINETTWEFKLRQGVRFQNGEPFNAETVRYTVNRALNFPRSALPYLVRDITNIETPDPYTVRMTSRTPDPILPNKFAWIDMVPPKYAEQQGANFGEGPVGTGPYRLVSWNKGSELVTEANPDYWGGKPAISRVVYRIVTEPSTRTAMLLNGEADLITNVDPDLVERINASPRAKILRGPGLRRMLLVIGQQAEPLGDVRVRQALNYAVDRDSIIRNILRGYARKTMGLVQYVVPGHLTQLDGYYDYNPGKAKELLEAAGVPNGFTVDMYTPVGTFPKDKETAEAIASQYQRIGIRVNLITMEWGKFFAQLNSKQMRGLSYMRYGNSVGDPSEGYFYSFWSKGVRPYVTDARIDEMFEKAQGTVDKQRRLALYRELERHAITQVAPQVFLFELDNLWGLSRRLNWSQTPEETVNLRGARLSQ